MKNIKQRAGVPQQEKKGQDGKQVALRIPTGKIFLTMDLLV